eukprot:Pgem_evm1s8147
MFRQRKGEKAYRKSKKEVEKCTQELHIKNQRQKSKDEKIRNELERPHVTDYDLGDFNGGIAKSFSKSASVPSLQRFSIHDDNSSGNSTGRNSIRDSRVKFNDYSTPNSQSPSRNNSRTYSRTHSMLINNENPEGGETNIFAIKNCKLSLRKALSETLIFNQISHDSQKSDLTKNDYNDDNINNSNHSTELESALKAHRVSKTNGDINGNDNNNINNNGLLLESLNKEMKENYNKSNDNDYGNTEDEESSSEEVERMRKMSHVRRSSIESAMFLANITPLKQQNKNDNREVNNVLNLEAAVVTNKSSRRSSSASARRISLVIPENNNNNNNNNHNSNNISNRTSVNNIDYDDVLENNNNNDINRNSLCKSKSEDSILNEDWFSESSLDNVFDKTFNKAHKNVSESILDKGTETSNTTEEQNPKNTPRGLKRRSKSNVEYVNEAIDDVSMKTLVQQRFMLSSANVKSRSSLISVNSEAGRGRARKNNFNVQINTLPKQKNAQLNNLTNSCDNFTTAHSPLSPLSPHRKSRTHSSFDNTPSQVSLISNTSGEQEDNDLASEKMMLKNRKRSISCSELTDLSTPTHDCTIEITESMDYYLNNLSKLTSQKTNRTIYSAWVSVKKQQKVDPFIYTKMMNTFVEKLFAIAPDSKAHLSNSLVQSRAFAGLLSAVVRKDGDEIDHGQISDIARSHIDLGVLPKNMFISFGVALIQTIGEALDSEFSPEVRAAWITKYGMVSANLYSNILSIHKRRLRSVSLGFKEIRRLSKMVSPGSQLIFGNEKVSS